MNVTCYLFHKELTDGSKLQGFMSSCIEKFFGICPVLFQILGMQIGCSCLKIKAGPPRRMDSGGGGEDGGTSALSIMNVKEKFQFLYTKCQAMFG